MTDTESRLQERGIILPRDVLAYADCTRCPGRATILHNDDGTHEARCPCGWTRVEIDTGGVPNAGF